MPSTTVIQATQIELETSSEWRPGQNQNHSSNFEHDGEVIQQLRPADGGLGAWQMLITAWVFESILWG